MSDPAPAVGSFSLHPALPITILATSLGFVVVQLDGSILNVALPQIGISLGTSVDGLQWTVDAYFLVFAVLLLSADVLSDRLGARRAFVSGFTVFSVASLACTLAPSPAALSAARTGMNGLEVEKPGPREEMHVLTKAKHPVPAPRGGQILALSPTRHPSWATLVAPATQTGDHGPRRPKDLENVG